MGSEVDIADLNDLEDLMPLDSLIGEIEYDSDFGSSQIKMAFILGVTFRISDTRGPIGIKIWGYIELTLRLCNVIFSTSGRKSKPEMGPFTHETDIISA